MAWQARVVAIKKDVSNVKDIYVDCEFYDTAAPSVPLHTKRFFFPVQTTNGAMRRVVEDEGRYARETYDRAAQLTTAFPPGTTIDIPT